jgi:hypothetical protein
MSKLYAAIFEKLKDNGFKTDDISRLIGTLVSTKQMYDAALEKLETQGLDMNNVDDLLKLYATVKGVDLTVEQIPILLEAKRKLDSIETQMREMGASNMESLLSEISALKESNRTFTSNIRSLNLDPDTYVETLGSSLKDKSPPGPLEPLPGGEGQEKPAGTQARRRQTPGASVSR